ncbi:sugar ABC transporter ATP-binding protein [Devosia rhodophyticola]|uniref:Sugar ABC transporter ATP-binding protein n=1 Tax=Devosia rhodophyticola TaxID=3026423 RepID=A0ABY7YX28_9HYPH|nr:sugar ABC transporter ATP-binding protein [Devosia rhodophyticola]WDR05876.1 sugar ABC transporter ATP-binding protein [Devosia rhodophyticola]
MPLLTLKDVTKAYGGVPALKGVDMDIAPGEIHALMGENGAGKSTLIKILAGVVAPDRADIRFDNEPVSIGNPQSAHRLGLRFIHQEFNVVPALSVAENIFLGRAYPRRGGFLVDWRALNQAARTTLHRLGISHIDPRRALGSLTLGDQMLVRISSAFVGEAGTPARLYVLDEPTASLSRDESQRLFTVLDELRNSGASVLYVSHRLDEIMSICDKATVIRDGRSVDTGLIADITHDDLVTLMIGRRVEEAYPPRVGVPSTTVMFSAQSLAIRGGRSLTFDVKAGEILGIAGLANVGQRNVLRTLFGDISAAGGAMLLGDAPYRPKSPADAWRTGIGYVPRERRSEGLILSRPIFENASLPHLAQQSLWRSFLTPRREQRSAVSQGELVRLKAAGPKQRVRELSGGNQQKVVFAKALAGEVQLLLLDEPTRGVDVGAKFDIYTIIREMAARGMGVVLVSSDLPELLGMADRIAVMREGAITDIINAADTDEEQLLNLCYGRTTG